MLQRGRYNTHTWHVIYDLVIGHSGLYMDTYSYIDNFNATYAEKQSVVTYIYIHRYIYEELYVYSTLKI